MGRRTYDVKLNINGRDLDTVIIDPHYEEKHADSVNDETILTLVKQLDGRTFGAIDKDEEGYKYFVNDHMELNGLFFKLIWLLHDTELFVGVVNTYRR
jgi:hypothetical protein